MNGQQLDKGTLMYSVIDMTLDGRKGDVINTKKRQVLTFDSLAGAITSVPGNCGDIWLIVLSKAGFLSYQITEEGISDKPILSANPTAITSVDRYSHYISPNREMLALVNGGQGGESYLMNFDASTGKLGNAKAMTTKIGAAAQFSGACFSSDNSQLYCTRMDRNGCISKYNISRKDSANFDFKEAEYIMGLNSPSRIIYRSIMLYNDTIYLGNINNKGFIDVIIQPNLPDSASRWQQKFIPLATGTSNSPGGSPNFVVYPLPPDSIYQIVMDSSTCGNMSLALNAPAEATEVHWDNGSTEPSRTIDKSGTYWLKYVKACTYYTDTFNITGLAVAPATISYASFVLSVPDIYNTYQWLLDNALVSGATTHTLATEKNGQYRVIVSNTAGCTDTSEIYDVTDHKDVSVFSCTREAIEIYPNPAANRLYLNTNRDLNVMISRIDGKVLHKQGSAREVDISKLPGGMYILQVYASAEGQLLARIKFVKQ